jgi:hypothetical protein
VTPTLVKQHAPLRKSIAREPGGAPNATAVLAIILATYLMIVLDISVVIAALPKIHRALDFSPTGLSWVQSAYTLSFGGLLLLGARAGDILGRRRMLVLGIALFTAASLAGGLAPRRPGCSERAPSRASVPRSLRLPRSRCSRRRSARDRPARGRSRTTAPSPVAVAASAWCSAGC